jgi:hypothetical protein
MNRPSLAWVDTALALEEENRALRALVLELAVALVRDRALFGFAQDEIESRFKEAA